MSRPLQYGDLVTDGHGSFGILVTHPARPGTDCRVAWGNGTEELMDLSELVGVPLLPALDNGSLANFHEWLVPTGRPVERALAAFGGLHLVDPVFLLPLRADDAAAAAVAQALFVSLAQRIARMPFSAFDGTDKREFIGRIVVMLTEGINQGQEQEQIN